jgi:hypothetical protein
MCQFPLKGGSFELDNHTVSYRKLKAFLVDSPGWAWIEPLTTQLKMEGTPTWRGLPIKMEKASLANFTTIAKAKLDTLHYRNEWRMSFELCMEVMTKCFDTLHTDPDQRYSDQQKVEKLLKAVHCQDAELLAAKMVINQQHPRDFIRAWLWLLFTISGQSPWTISAGVLTSQVQQTPRRLRPRLTSRPRRPGTKALWLQTWTRRLGTARPPGRKEPRSNNINSVNFTNPPEQKLHEK